MKRILSLLFVFMFCVTTVFAEGKPFLTSDDLNEWINGYYLNPSPERSVNALVSYTTTPAIEQKSGREPMAVFFANIYRKNPQQMKKSFNAVSELNNTDSKLFFLTILWWTQTEESKKMIGRIQKEWIEQDILVLSKIMAQKTPINLFETPINSPAHLDLLWATYFSTGDVRAVKKVITALPLMKVKGDRNRMITGGAANWSLMSNAYTQESVLKILENEVKNLQGDTKDLLKHIISEVHKELAKKEDGIQ